MGKVSARPTVRLFLHQSSRLRARHPAAFPLGDSGFVSTLGADGARLAWTGCPSALCGCGCARTQMSLPTQLCFVQTALCVLQGKTNFSSPKPSGLGGYCRFARPLSLLPLLGIRLRPEHGWHAGLGTAAWGSETVRPTTAAIRCSPAVGQGLRAKRWVSQDPF